jgi:arylsulfatase A-like enzyme
LFREQPAPVIVRSAAYSALIWLGYAQVEYFLSVLIPLRFDGFALPISHWRSTAIVFGAYAALGAVVGVLAGAAAALLRSPKQRPPAAILASLGFLATYVAWLVASGAWREAGGASIGMALILAGVLAPGVRSGPCSAWRTMLASPWVLPVVLFCPLKLVEYWKLHAHAAVWAVCVACAVVVLAVAFLVSRLRPLFELLAAPSAFGRKAVLFCGISAVILGASFLLDRPLPPAPPLGAAQAQGAARPNVLLVIWDTARADHQSVYGYRRDTTPFLREFAERATLYKNGFAASDMTLSASASLYTGLYASWHGAHFSRAAPYGRPLDRKIPTMAEILQRQGYTTMAVIANCSYLAKSYQLDRGFQLYDVRTPVGADIMDRPYSLRPLLQRLLSPKIPVGEFDRRFRRGDGITDDVLKLLGTAGKRGAPFFLVANYMDAHTPYIPPPPYDTLYPGKDPLFTYGAMERLRKEVLQLRRVPTARESAHVQSQYDGAMAFLDAQARRLVDGLRRFGLYDSTMIVFTADHGEALGEHRLIEHAVSVYGDQVHIPMLVKYPNQPQGAVVTAPVSAIDVLPTVLEVAGIAVPDHLQGRSLRQPDESRLVLSESFPSGLLAGWHPRFNRVERSVVRWPLKFIHSTAGKAELYNLAADPAEARNLFSKEKPAAADLRRLLSAIVASAPASSAAPHKIDPRDLERLRSLGYVQ